MNTQSKPDLSKVYDFLKRGELSKAHEELVPILQIYLDDAEILYILRCIRFWQTELSRAEILPSDFEKGENIISQWKSFSENFAREDGNRFEKSTYAIRQGIFSLALEQYENMFNDTVQQPKAELYRKVGLCYKKLGDYETALKHLEKANSIVSRSATILSEMADCYALCGEERTAKVLFREAFFIDPQKVDLTLLDSEMICCLIKKTEQYHHSGAILQEWIPVYGVLFGVFTVKRELRPIEIGQLKQAIYALENALKESANEPSLLIPRLINHYIWLIDYCNARNDSSRAIHDTLLKIRLLDEEIYNKYKTCV